MGSHRFERLDGLVAKDADPLARLGKVKVPQTRFASIPLVRSTEKVEIVFRCRDQHLWINTQARKGTKEREEMEAQTVERTVVPGKTRVPDHDPFVGGLPVVVSSAVKVCLFRETTQERGSEWTKERKTTKRIKPSIK